MTLGIIQTTDKFPKPQQYYGLASELRGSSLSLLKTIAEANVSHTPMQHQEIDALLQQIRIMSDLACDLRYINPDQKDSIHLATIEIGKMNGGWIRSIV